MKRKGITPVIATVLLLMLAVGAVGAAFAFIQGIQQDVFNTINQQRQTETNVRALQCYTHKGNGDTGAFEVDIQNTGDRVLDVSSVDFTVRMPDGSINYSLSKSTADMAPATASQVTDDGIAVLRNQNGWPGTGAVVRYQINATSGMKLSHNTPYSITMSTSGHTILSGEICTASRP